MMLHMSEFRKCLARTTHNELTGFGFFSGLGGRLGGSVAVGGTDHNSGTVGEDDVRLNWDLG